MLLLKIIFILFSQGLTEYRFSVMWAPCIKIDIIIDIMLLNVLLN